MSEINYIIQEIKPLTQLELLAEGDQPIKGLKLIFPSAPSEDIRIKLKELGFTFQGSWFVKVKAEEELQLIIEFINQLDNIVIIDFGFDQRDSVARFYTLGYKGGVAMVERHDKKRAAVFNGPIPRKAVDIRTWATREKNVFEKAYCELNGE